MRHRPRILIVDDEPNMCRTLAITLSEDERYQVTTALSAKEALAKLTPDTDLVLTDLSMPGMDGLELMRRVKQSSRDTQVIMMTAYSTVQSAVEAMRLGAHEYLIKPFSGDELIESIEGALKQNRAARDARRARTLRGENRCGELVGASEPMQRLFHLVERAAETDSTVLITGESGTGKELVARAIHYGGRRADAGFVVVNCAALAPTLLESELFGHEKGAFTGAIKLKIGRLEQAHGGTIFLDEIAELTPALQTKLLRALQERTFERVGGNEPITVDIRVVAATNRDLEQAIASGAFREDLYYRLNVITIHAPPLRERLDDVPLLCEVILADKAAERGVAPKGLAPEALAALKGYPFPGNVRELENILERAMVLSDGAVILPTDLPPLQRKARANLEQFVTQVRGGWGELHEAFRDLERQLIERAITELGDRPNDEIARLLGTSRRVLELRLSEYGISKRRS
ncbi:MAG TPA: sigma-54 dependent transcriptional regulator [Polyangia bacterium]